MKKFYFRPPVLFGVILILLFSNVSAQNFHLVKDINTATNSNPQNNHIVRTPVTELFKDTFAVLNHISYFNADDGEHGRGLWRTDGTPQGTYQLKEGIDPQFIVAGNDMVFFSAKSTAKLWKSDGTAAGTMPVLDTIPPGLIFFEPNNITNVNGTIYFSIQRGYGEYTQLWKTDGTAPGTVLVKDFFDLTDGFRASPLRGFTPVFDKLFFTFPDKFSGDQVWVSNGTPEGTYKTSDSSGYASNIVAPFSASPDSALVYFLASKGTPEPYTLWVTNGQPGNGQPISQLGLPNLKTFKSITTIDTVLFLVGTSSPQAGDGNSLYRYDRTSGFKPVALFNGYDPDAGVYAGIRELGQAGQRLFFTVYNIGTKQNELWATNTENTGAQLVKSNIRATKFTDIGATMYFTNNDPVTGNELWKSDGTSAGTVLVKDMVPGATSSDPSTLTQFGHYLLFAATDDRHGRELWKYDSNIDSIILVNDINTVSTDSAKINFISPLKDKVVFIAKSGYGQTNFDLWSSDGTSAGTQMIRDSTAPNLFSQLGAPPRMTVAGNNAYYFYKVNDNVILFTTDATPAGTIAIDTFNAATEVIGELGATDSLFYFTLTKTVNNQEVIEIWRTNGTSANTFSIGNIGSHSTGTQPHYVGKNGNTLYYTKSNYTSNNYIDELWSSDGTQLGTTQLTGFSASKGFSYNGQFVFQGSNGSTSGFYITDGTIPGTKLLKANLSSPISDFKIYNGKLFFCGSDGQSGSELYKTDGTPAGTELVKDLNPGSGSALPYNFTELNGNLYFITGLLAFGTQLWRTDGTTAGTQFVKLLAGPSSLVALNGRIYFLAYDSVRGLWESDGTDAGTHPVSDTGLVGVEIPVLAYASDNLVIAGNKLFFNGINKAYGNELWAGSPGSTLPVTLINFAANLRGNDGVVQWTVTSNSINKAFELQRSINSVDFTTIAKMPGANGFSKNDYTYTDKYLDDLHVQKVYYRLRLIDIDGSVSYSKIVTLNLQKTNIQITVAPNPVKQSLRISSPVDISAATIKIMDLSGRVFISRNQNIAANNTISINLSSLSKGGYVVNVSGTGINYNFKIIKD